MPRLSRKDLDLVARALRSMNPDGPLTAAARDVLRRIEQRLAQAAARQAEFQKASPSRAEPKRRNPTISRPPMD